MDSSTKWTPNPEQRLILEALQTESRKEKTQADFVRKYLGAMSESTISKVFAALDPSPERKSYFDSIQHPDDFMDELADALEAIRIRRLREAESERQKILPLSKHEKVIKAVKQCLKKSGCERLIIFRAPTGGSKSILCARLAREFGARIAQTRQGWKKSYYAALCDVAEALGINIGAECRTTFIEDDIIAHCKMNPLLLVIDEAEYMRGDALNSVKLLLNRTNVTVLICIDPYAHDAWKRHSRLQAQQLERRQHAWFEQSAVSVEDAALFFPANQFEQREGALKMIAEAASTFGHFSFINTVAEKLEGIRNADENQVKKAINSALRRMRKAAQNEEES